MPTPTPAGQTARPTRFLRLALGATGVVFGDIGTSPIYTMRLVFDGDPFRATQADVMGGLSLIFWSLTIVIAIKYTLVILRADNKGEGGILALMALGLAAAKEKPKIARTLTMIGLAGAALFFGDSLITPAISVLSAVEGVAVAVPGTEFAILPLAVVIIAGLFAFQRRGTHWVGALFGPIIVIWFLTLGVLGIGGILMMPAILEAINPIYGIELFLAHPVEAFLGLGLVVLAVTGGEALYADMGHFGRGPIRAAWYGLAMPALMLNYFGQGALMLTDSSTVGHPFFLLAPEWALIPLTILTILATIIASQAVISGAFSVARQAVQLGFWPRMEIRHTSEAEIGQVYLPQVNRALFVGVMALVLAFGSSDDLANSYGVAVTGAMLCDTLIASYVLWQARWLPRWALIALFTVFLVVDLAFFSSSLFKIFSGGTVPLLVGMGLFTMMLTWKQGQALVARKRREGTIGIPEFLASIKPGHPERVTGAAIYLTPYSDGVPQALLHNLKHNKTLHERVVFLTVRTEAVPKVPKEKRAEIGDLGKGFFRIILHYGFTETPNVPLALARLHVPGMALQPMDTSYVLGRETLHMSRKPALGRFRTGVFLSMANRAEAASAFFRIPANRVVELGAVVDI